MLEDIDSTAESKQKFKDMLVKKYPDIDVDKALSIAIAELDKVQVIDHDDEESKIFVKALHSQLNQHIIISIIEKYINSYKHMNH